MKKREPVDREKNKVDLSKIDLEKEKDKVADFPGLMEYAHHVGSGLIKPEDKGKIKGRAMAAMREQTNMQMQQIYEQMKTLASQAKDLQSRVEVSERIYTAQMSFQPLVGQTYYLYEKEDGSDVLSMIAPDEWGKKKKPFTKFIARVSLLADHTWNVDLSE